MSKPYLKKNLGSFHHQKSQSLLIKDNISPTNPTMKEKSTFIDYNHTRNISVLNANLPPTNDNSTSLHEQSKWKKVYNIVHSINFLKNFDTKSIQKETDIDSELLYYKNHIHSNSKPKDYANSINPNKSADEQQEKTKKLFIEALTSDRINNTNKSRENFKEEIAYNISYNNSNALSVIDEIYRYNPDRNTRNEIDPEFIFNTPLISNGKTLLYIACQEGKEDIVEYFLNKKLNVRIRSKIDKNTDETPVECACRWNYLKIVKLLLTKVKYTKEEISSVLKIKGLSKSVIEILREYNKKIKKSKVSCFCL